MGAQAGRNSLSCPPHLSRSPKRCPLMSSANETMIMADKSNPVVFFDVAYGGQPMGRVKIELFANICPKTAENFRQFCTGEHKYVLEIGLNWPSAPLRAGSSP